MTSIRRVGLITGAASGIGRAAAVALAEVGFDVVVNYCLLSQHQGMDRVPAALRGCAGQILESFMDCEKRG